MTNPLLGKSVTIRKGGRTRKISQYAWNLTSDKKGWEEVGKSTDNTAPTPGPRTISTKANKFKTPMATTSFIPDEIANTKTIADKPVISTEEEAKELEKPVIKPLGGNNSENPNPAIPVAPVIPPLTGSGEKQAPGKHTAHKPEQKVPNTGKGKGS